MSNIDNTSTLPVTPMRNVLSSAITRVNTQETLAVRQAIIYLQLDSHAILSSNVTLPTLAIKRQQWNICRFSRCLCSEIYHFSFLWMRQLITPTLHWQPWSEPLDQLQSTSDFHGTSQQAVLGQDGSPANILQSWWKSNLVQGFTELLVSESILQNGCFEKEVWYDHFTWLFLWWVQGGQRALPRKTIQANMVSFTIID